jgi:hypothetical protein
VSRLTEEKIVDRDDEANILEQLLRFETPKRVFVISGGSGQGKSETLRKLQYLCDSRFDVPVALISMEEFEGRPDELTLTARIADALGERGLAFAEFNRLRRALVFEDPQPFLQLANRPSPLGEARFDGADISGGIQAGVVIQVQHALSVSAAGVWTEEAAREAKRQCVNAFSDDLAAYARQRALVVMLDALDKSSDALKKWIYLQLVKGQVLDRIGDHPKLVLVLAGVDLHIEVQNRFGGALRLFELLTSLKGIPEERFEEVLAVHGYGTLLVQHGDYLRVTWRQEGISLGTLLGIAELVKGQQP